MAGSILRRNEFIDLGNLLSDEFTDLFLLASNDSDFQQRSKSFVLVFRREPTNFFSDFFMRNSKAKNSDVLVRSQTILASCR